MATYEAVTSEEETLLAQALADGEPLPAGYAYNPGWSPRFRKVVDGGGSPTYGPVDTLLDARLDALESPRANTIIPIGDSITGNNSGATSWGPSDWPVAFVGLTDGRLRMVRNAGVPGNTTTQMLARLQTDVIDYMPGWCMVQGGTNDLPGTELSVIMGNLTTIWDTCRSAHIEPIAVCPPPKNASPGELSELAAAIRLAAQARGLLMVDHHALLVDPATGQYRAGMSSDGVHPVSSAALTMAEHALTVLDTSLPVGGAPLAVSAVDDGNLIANGVFTDDDDATVGLGDGWSWVGSLTGATRSIDTSDTDIVGGWQQVAVTGAGQRYFYQQTITTGFSVGDVLEFCGRVGLSGATGGMTVSARIDKNSIGGGVIHQPVYNLAVNTDVVFRVRVTVPADATKIIPIIINSATGTGTFRAAQLALRNLTALGVV